MAGKTAKKHPESHLGLFSVDRTLSEEKLCRFMSVSACNKIGSKMTSDVAVFTKLTKLELYDMGLDGKILVVPGLSVLLRDGK